MVSTNPGISEYQTSAVMWAFAVGLQYTDHLGYLRARQVPD